MAILLLLLWGAVSVGKDLQAGKQNKAHLEQLKEVEEKYKLARNDMDAIVVKGIKSTELLKRKVRLSQKKVAEYVQKAIKDNTDVVCFPDDWVRAYRELTPTKKVPESEPQRLSSAPAARGSGLWAKHRRIPVSYVEQINIIGELTTS